MNVLDRVGVSGTEEDAIVLQEMRGIANELQECPVPDLMPFQQMLLYARDMPQELRVGARLPKPGSLYISSLPNGDQREETDVSSRMDEHSWSGNIRQNPMLSMKSADGSVLGFKQPCRDKEIGNAFVMVGLG